MRWGQKLLIDQYIENHIWEIYKMHERGVVSYVVILNWLSSV